MDDSMDVPESRFWGVVLQPGKRYEQTSKHDFHISMAVLDVARASDKSQAQVTLEVEGQQYILCHLQRTRCVQQTLDLQFDAGDTVAFSVDGDTAQPVHLTGYYTTLTDDDMEDMPPFDDMLEEEEDEAVPQLLQASKKPSSPVKKQKAVNGHGPAGIKQNGDVSQAGTKRKNLEQAGKAAKLSKPAAADSSLDEEDEDDDDYEDLNDDEGEEIEDEEVEEGFDDDDDMGIDSDDEDDESDEEDQEVLKKMPTAKPAVKTDKNKVKSKSDGFKKEPVTPKTKLDKKQDSKTTPAVTPQEKKPAGTPKSLKKTLGGGVMIEDIVVGSGAEAKPGRPVTVYYVGRLKQNNKQIDATTSGPGFKFRLGNGDVIKGWDRGVAGMLVGGKRRITCPPNMAYGKRGSPPTVPPNSTLVFEITLKNTQ